MTADPHDESRREARSALVRAEESLQQALAQNAEVSRVTQSLRTFRQGDMLALDLERAMRTGSNRA